VVSLSLRQSSVLFFTVINIDRYVTNVLRKQLVVTVVMLMEFQAKTWLIG
jgi:hypothetical protein